MGADGRRSSSKFSFSAVFIFLMQFIRIYARPLDGRVYIYSDTFPRSFKFENNHCANHEVSIQYFVVFVNYCDFL